jgi:pimeloyl-ACP methyl ester carboxylesterase
VTAAAPIVFRGAGGITLRGERWGDGGPPVLFTQGNGFCVQCYRDAFATVAGRATVHALNSRGHGGSGVPPHLDNWDGMVEDLRLYLKAHFPGPALVAGHSMGATVSLRLAAESPELVAGLLLMEPNLVRGRREPWPDNHTGIQLQMIEGAQRRRDRWESRAEAAAWLRERGTYRGWAEGPFQAFIAAGLEEVNGGVRLACPPWLEAQAYATLPDAVMYQWAERLRAPAVIVRAEDSPVVSPAGLEDFIRAAPIAVVLSVKGSHSFPMQHPHKAGQAIAMGLEILLGAGQPRAAKAE